MIKRRRFKQTQTFKQRLEEEAARFRMAAEQAPPGMARELLLRRVRQTETALHINEWLRPSTPQLPRQAT